MLWCVVWQMLVYISEELTAIIIRVLQKQWTPLKHHSISTRLQQSSLLTVRSWNLTIHTFILSLSILNIYPSEYYNNSCSLPVRKWAVVFSCSGNTDNHITTGTDLLPYSIYGLLLTVQRMQLTHIPLVATTQDSKQQNILYNFSLVFLVITFKPSWNTGRINFFQ
jgi:hypothetical protein